MSGFDDRHSFWSEKRFTCFLDTCTQIKCGDSILTRQCLSTRHGQVGQTWVCNTFNLFSLTSHRHTAFALDWLCFYLMIKAIVLCKQSIRIGYWRFKQEKGIKITKNGLEKLHNYRLSIVENKFERILYTHVIYRRRQPSWTHKELKG